MNAFTPIVIVLAGLGLIGSEIVGGFSQAVADDVSHANDATAENSPTKQVETPKAEKSASRIPDAFDKPVSSEQSIVIDGKQISYRTEAGMLPLLKDDGSPKASVFFVSYTLNNTGNTATRPMLFWLNGGPGASAVWLHLGGLGPRRALVNEDGTLPPPPYALVDNQYTTLVAADLVFIDPVATGYSRAAKDEKPEQFFGEKPDIAAIGEFIRLYTTRHKRWRSPKYLCGESYGVFRVAGLARELQDAHGMFLNGLVLMSGLVDFDTILNGPCNDLPYGIFLPSLTAVAHFHKKLPTDLQENLPKAMAESRAFAAGDYATALYAGTSLPAERRTAVAVTLARLTGLPEKLILDHDLRIKPEIFRKQLLRKENLICGRFDGRITGRDGDPSAVEPAFDPSFSAAMGPLASTMNAYVREELGFESDMPYKVLAGVGPWSFEQNRFASTSQELAESMAQNPHMRVLVQAGLCDLAVPADSMRHSVNHLLLDSEVRKNISFAEYQSGHMMYLNLPDIKQLKVDLEAFLTPSTR